MSFGIGEDFRRRGQTFNITPIIDIVFLLIIFFLVVCQFIEAENFPVAVPDGCEFAQSEPEYRDKITTVTVMETADGGGSFAVGSEKISTADNSDLVDRLTQLIDVSLEDLPPGRRVVTLRIDKGVCFAEAQYALVGIAASTATDIQLVAFKDKQASPK